MQKRIGVTKLYNGIEGVVLQFLRVALECRLPIFNLEILNVDGIVLSGCLIYLLCFLQHNQSTTGFPEAALGSSQVGHKYSSILSFSYR